MGYVDRFIRELTKNELNKNKDRIVYNLNPGDIIWAKRYSKDEIMQNIELEHREGPFIVVYKDKNKRVFCLDCSSKADTKASNLVKLYAEKYPKCFYRDTYVKLKKCIEMTNYRYIRKIGELSKFDRNLLFKRLYLELSIPPIERYIGLSPDYFTFELGTGDVIDKDNELFLIGSKHDGAYSVYKVNEVRYNEDFTINKIKYKVDYLEKKSLSTNGNYRLLTCHHERKRLFQGVCYKGVTAPTQGAVAEIDGELYLVYKYMKEFWGCIRLYRQISNDNSKEKLKINNIQYKTKYDLYKIYTDIECNVIDYCEEFDIKELEAKLAQKEDIDFNNAELLSIKNKVVIDLDSRQKELMEYLKQYEFSFEELVGVMVALRDEKNILKFNEYVALTNNLDKDRIISLVKNIIGEDVKNNGI